MLTVILLELVFMSQLGACSDIFLRGHVIATDDSPRSAVTNIDTVKLEAIGGKE